MFNLLQKQVFIFINMIDKKWIGATITIRKKGITQTVTIEDKPEMYAAYRAYGLDHIFKSEPKKMTFPKTKRRKKKSDTNLPDTEQQGSIDTNGEDNNK